MDPLNPQLAATLHETVQSLLPADARFVVVWLVPDGPEGRVDLDTAVLNCLANVPMDVVNRMGQMMSSRPTETLLVSPQYGSS